MTYLLIILFIAGYGILLFYWNRKVAWRLGELTTTIIKTIHFVAFAICIIVAVLFAYFDIGLGGLWTTRIIIIITLTTGIFFKFLANRKAVTKFENWYFTIFSLLPVFTTGLLFIPFLGVVLVVSLFGQLTDPATTIYYEDDKLRVQSTFVGVLGPPRIDIYEKKLLFEKHLKRADYWGTDIDSIKVFYDRDSTRVVAYGVYDYDKQGKPAIIFLEPFR